MKSITDFLTRMFMGGIKQATRTVLDNKVLIHGRSLVNYEQITVFWHHPHHQLSLFFLVIFNQLKKTETGVFLGSYIYDLYQQLSTKVQMNISVIIMILQLDKTRSKNKRKLE